MTEKTLLALLDKYGLTNHQGLAGSDTAALQHCGRELLYELLFGTEYCLHMASGGAPEALRHAVDGLDDALVLSELVA